MGIRRPAGRQSDRAVFPWGDLPVLCIESQRNSKVMIPFWIEFETAALWQLVSLAVVCFATFTSAGMLRSGRM